MLHLTFAYAAKNDACGQIPNVFYSSPTAHSSASCSPAFNSFPQALVISRVINAATGTLLLPFYVHQWQAASRSDVPPAVLHRAEGKLHAGLASNIRAFKSRRTGGISRADFFSLSRICQVCVSAVESFLLQLYVSILGDYLMPGFLSWNACSDLLICPKFLYCELTSCLRDPRRLSDSDENAPL